MTVLANTVFLGCNYNDKKIKRQFDTLKAKIEKDTPLSCVIIDKRQGKSARDLWKDIRAHIEESAATIFDVTGFSTECRLGTRIRSLDQIRGPYFHHIQEAQISRHKYPGGF